MLVYRGRLISQSGFLRRQELLMLYLSSAGTGQCGWGERKCSGKRLQKQNKRMLYHTGYPFTVIPAGRRQSRSLNSYCCSTVGFLQMVSMEELCLGIVHEREREMRGNYFPRCISSSAFHQLKCSVQCKVSYTSGLYHLTPLPATWDMRFHAMQYGVSPKGGSITDSCVKKAA